MFDKKKKIIYNEGMKCNHCAEKVKEALSSITNVKKVKIDLDSNCAVLTYSKIIDDEELKNKIENLDYKVIRIEN